MSHYAVAVFTNGEQTYDELLEPYDENLSDPHIITKEEMIRKSRESIEHYRDGEYAKYLKDPDTYKESYADNERHIKYITEEFPAKLLWTDDDCYEDEIRWYESESIRPDGSVFSTYNRNSKWDWYIVGGRFCDSVPLADGTFCDHADMSEVDIDYVDKEEYESSLRFWKLCIDESITSDEDDELDPLFYRKSYYTNRYKDAEEYARDCSRFTFYAALLPSGEWVEPGQMGWFGCSSASAEDDIAWRERQRDILKEAKDNNWHITIVDCHI